MSFPNPNEHSDRPIIFVAGLARSGTTLFQSIFCRHPTVFSFPETHFFESVGELSLYGESLTARTLEMLGEDLINRGGVTHEEWSAVRTLFEHTRSASAQVEQLFWCLIEFHRKPVDGRDLDIPLEKTPGHVFQLEHLLKRFPGACFFLLRRNPRDYANSISKCAWAPASLAGVGSLWSDTVRLIDHFSRSNPRRVMVVDYEELIKRPENVMEACFEHAGLEFQPCYLTGLRETGPALVRPAEKTWKERNLSQDSVRRSSSVLDLSLRQRLRLMLSVDPSALRRYRLRHLRF